MGTDNFNVCPPLSTNLISPLLMDLPFSSRRVSHLVVYLTQIYSIFVSLLVRWRELLPFWAVISTLVLMLSPLYEINHVKEEIFSYVFFYKLNMHIPFDQLPRSHITQTPYVYCKLEFFWGYSAANAFMVPPAPVIVAAVPRQRYSNLQ